MDKPNDMIPIDGVEVDADVVEHLRRELSLAQFARQELEGQRDEARRERDALIRYVLMLESGHAMPEEHDPRLPSLRAIRLERARRCRPACLIAPSLPPDPALAPTPAAPVPSK